MENELKPILKKVMRLDSTPLTRAFYTEEGYLKDTPVVTSTGIFEYANPDGTTRKELRLPEDVFDPKSLASFEGAPVICTHNAGLIDKDNVHKNQIGTILSEGYRDGNDVRAKIIIHDTDEMKRSGLKELSLGYNLDLEEEPGEWNGMHYDAIQRNIRINHLALVRDARAGEQARLNIDSKDGETLIGGKLMGKVRKNVLRNDEALSPEELQKAIEWYKQYRIEHGGEEKTDEDEPIEEKEIKDVEAVVELPDNEIESVVGEEQKADQPEVNAEPVAVEPIEAPVEEEVDVVEEEETKPEFAKDAEAVIRDQDNDIKTLLDIIDTLLAEKDFNEAEDSADEELQVGEEELEEDVNTDGCGEDDKLEDAVELENEDEEDEELEGVEEIEEEEIDDEDIDEEEFDEEDVEEEDIDAIEELHMDSIDRIVNERIRLGMLGRNLNLDGLENMKTRDAKVAIIKAVRPSVRLDGKSAAYVDALFDLAAEDASKREWKGTAYQRRQMFNKDSAVNNDTPSSKDAREKMIERYNHKEGK